MINLDMTNNVNGFNGGGRDEMMPLLKSIGDQIKAIDEEFGNQLANSPGLHSDNQTFLMEGIPAADPLGKLTRSVLDCYHANCDDFSLVNKKRWRTR